MISELAPFGDLKDFINTRHYSGKRLGVKWYTYSGGYIHFKSAMQEDLPSIH